MAMIAECGPESDYFDLPGILKDNRHWIEVVSASLSSEQGHDFLWRREMRARERKGQSLGG